MKKYLVFVALAIALFGLPAFAQKATRVTFKPGATSAVLTGSLRNYEGKRVYRLRVRDGQTLKVEDIGNDPARAVSIYVVGPPGSVEQDLGLNCHGASEITPTTAGDYIITVQECQKVDRWRGTFKVRFTVN